MIKIFDEEGKQAEQNLADFKDKGHLVSESATIKVPLSLLLLIDHLTKYVGGNEYALVYKCRRIQETLNWEVDAESVFIPLQKTTVSNVTINEDVGNYNGVVHRHPSGCKKFSKTDEETLNSLFTASFIYIPYLETPDAIVNISVDNVAKIQVPAKVVIFNDVVLDFEFVGGSFKPTQESVNSMLVDCFPHIMGDDLGQAVINSKVSKITPKLPIIKNNRPVMRNAWKNESVDPYEMGVSSFRQRISAATERQRNIDLEKDLGHEVLDDIALAKYMNDHFDFY